MNGAGFPYRIDDGIPVPPMNYRKGGRPPLVDWSTLKVGQSCLVGTRSEAHLAYTFANRNPGVSFRIVKQREERGWRIWRVT